MLDLNTLRALLERHGEALRYPVRALELGGRQFDFSRQRALMGVINLSPDSWYRESVCTSEGEAIERGLRLAREGADFIDIGAESTLPQAKRVGPGEQIERMLPVVRALAERGQLVSVESYYPEVLEAAAGAGAKLFNLTGNESDDAVLRLAAKHKAAVIFCHVQGSHVRDVGDLDLAADPVAAMSEALSSPGSTTLSAWRLVNPTELAMVRPSLPARRPMPLARTDIFMMKLRTA